MLLVADRGPLPPPPKISLKTIPMVGHLVDVYGLDELLSQGRSDGEQGQKKKVACLWLHHGRNGKKEEMGDFACRAVGESLNKKKEEERGLIALAFDQRNHGTRLVCEEANQAWNRGNDRHAVDMMGLLRGMVEDNKVLIDLVEAYLFGDCEKEEMFEVDMHLVLGWSLGGHSAWQLMFGDERVEAGVVIIGCPDYMNLMTDRARICNLPTYNPSDPSSFLGSKHFPPDLVRTCTQHDPKGILFGTGPVPQQKLESLPSEEQARLIGILESRIGGKKFLVCSGAEDKVVPYTMSEPFMNFFETASISWFLQNRVHEGVGHKFSPGMVEDAVDFVMDALENGPKKAWK